jgi:hypothetical protein
MRRLILNYMVKDFISWVGREPSQREMDDLNESADMFARDLKRIVRADLKDYIGANKINKENT